MDETKAGFSVRERINTRGVDDDLALHAVHTKGRVSMCRTRPWFTEVVCFAGLTIGGSPWLRRGLGQLLTRLVRTDRRREAADHFLCKRRQLFL